MQDLPLSDYVKFCRVCKTFFDNKKIDELLLKAAFTARMERTNLIIKNFDNSEVMALLEEVLEDRNVSKDFKDEIKSVLTGKFAGFKDIYFDNNQHIPTEKRI